MKDDDWDAVMDTNLKAVFRMSRAVMPPQHDIIIEINAVRFGKRASGPE